MQIYLNQAQTYGIITTDNHATPFTPIRGIPHATTARRALEEAQENPDLYTSCQRHKQHDPTSTTDELPLDDITTDPGDLADNAKPDHES